MRKIIFIFIVLILLNNIYFLNADMIISDGSGTTSGNTNVENYDSQSIKKINYPDEFNGIISGNSELGNVVGKKDGDSVSLKPEDIKSSGMVKLDKKDSVSDIEVINKGSHLQVKDKKIEVLDEKSKVSLDTKGNIKSADLTSSKKEGNILSMGGKDFHAPEGARVTMDKDPTKPIQVELKEGSKINEVPKKKVKKEGEEEEEQRNLQYRSLKGFTQLPDSVSEQLGFKGKVVDFKGILSHDGSNWFLDKSQDLTLRVDGKSIVMQNINGLQVTDSEGKLRTLTGINPTAEIFFGKTNFDTAVKSGYKGAYFVLDNNGVMGGTNNELDGHSLKLSKDNPWGINIVDMGHVAAVAQANSNFFFNKNSQIITNGKVIIDDDYINYRTDPETNKLFFNQGSKVPGFGEPKTFKDSINSPLELLPFKENNEPFPSNSKVIIGKSLDANPNNPTNFKLVPFEGKESDIGRVTFGEKPKESSAKSLVPVTETPVKPDISNLPLPTPPTPPPTQPPKIETPQVINNLLNGITYNPGLIQVKSSTGQQTNLDMFKEIGAKYDPNTHKALVLEFSATWCGGCRQSAPSVHNFAVTNPDIKVIPINVDTNNALATRYGITTFPTAVVIDPKTGNVLSKSGDVMGVLNGLRAEIK
jgi:thiol-disulfide isomerase/thioredoxin